MQNLVFRFIVYFFLFLTLFHNTLSTIDINLSQLEYLAARLDPFECRRLIAALHYTSYELPMNLAAAGMHLTKRIELIKKKYFDGAERTVDDEIPCIRQLVHWNESPGEGFGQTHELLVHRLRQLSRSDLADWLGKSVFNQLGKDIERIMDRPFHELEEQETETSYSITIVPVETTEEEETFWSKLHIVLLATALGLLGTLLTLIGYIIFHILQMRLHRVKGSNHRPLRPSNVSLKYSNE